MGIETDTVLVWFLRQLFGTLLITFSFIAQPGDAKCNNSKKKKTLTNYSPGGTELVNPKWRGISQNIQVHKKFYIYNHSLTIKPVLVYGS